LTITLPQESPADFWVRAVAILAVSLFCLVRTFWPGGETRIGTALVTHPGGVVPRLVSFAISAGLAVGFWADLRTRGVHATLTLRGTTLRYSRMSGLRVRMDDFDLSKYSDVGVGRDDEGIHLALLRRDGDGAHELLGRSSSRAARADLEAIAEIVRRAAWPHLAVEKPRSKFRRIDSRTLVSDRGFVVRLPEVDKVEYREGDRTIMLPVRRGWSADHAMCFVLDPEAPYCWDGPPTPLTPEERRAIRYNLTEALEEMGVRVLTDDAPDRGATV